MIGMQMVLGIEKMESIHVNTEIDRNRKILEYLVKNPVELGMVFDNLEHAGFLYGEHTVMVERFKQMLATGVSHNAVINMLKDFAVKAPQFFALLVSVAIYRLNK